MTILLETLNEIKKWHQQNNPKFSNLWQPGLTRYEIEKIIKVLPFRLSKELYELYEWGNGGYLYFPLEVAVQEYYKMENSFYPLWNPYWLPITNDLGSGYPTEDLKGYRVVVGDKETQNTSLMLNIDFESPEPGVWYPSITNMMLAIVEQYQMSSQKNDIEYYIQYRSMIDELQASLEQSEEPTKDWQHLALDLTCNLIQQANTGINQYLGELSTEEIEIYAQGSVHKKYNPGGNYLSIWHHRKEVAERPDGSKVETRYDPDTGMISGIEIHSPTGKTKELTYYYAGKPAYRTTHSYERSDCYQFSAWLAATFPKQSQSLKHCL